MEINKATVPIHKLYVKIWYFVYLQFIEVDKLLNSFLQDNY